MVGDAGEVCEDPKQTISSLEDCESAAVSLGANFAGEGSYETQFGCVIDANENLRIIWYNNRADGSIAEDRKPVCHGNSVVHQFFQEM